MTLVPNGIDPEEYLDHIYGNTEYYEETLFDVLINCVIPSTYSIFHTLYKVILVNLCFGLIISTGRVSQTMFHILSACAGIYLISCLESSKGKILIFTFFTLSYFLLRLGCGTQYKHAIRKNSNTLRYLSNSNVIKYSLITTFVFCEYYFLEPSIWLEIRGVVMVFAMKLISLSEDIDNGVTQFPKFFEYLGYVFCGGNIMFGPWISFQDYVMPFNNPTRKNIYWLYGIARALFVSICFLLISNCWSNYFITEQSNRWLIGYKEALSFRTSHYFICYLSEASMLAVGYKNPKMWHNDKQWRFSITDPVKIELPNALTTVVTNWNRPMHEFLKRHIYKSWLPLGKFYAILATFIASSFLHGFEIKVSVVLITIGLFSYVQFAVRDHLAQVFDCCIRVYSCKDCTHKYKRNSMLCRMCLLTFSALTVLHLIYLGVLMDPSTDEVGIYEKWSNLHFISFYIMIVNVLIIV